MSEAPFIIRSSPHWRDGDTAPRIMRRVILALMPAIAASIYFFRFRAVVLYAVCIAASLATEAVILRIRKKPLDALFDGSAVITGILLAMCLPASLPLSLALIGAVVSIGIGKQIFGGLGHNVFNPALVGRAFLSTAFPVAMTTWIPSAIMKVDTATFATPLGDLKFQDAIVQGTLVPLKSLFLGTVGGSLGETSAIALLIGGAYLLMKRTIDWRIPTGIILSMMAFTGVFWLAAPDKYASPLFHLLSGGFLLGALFMATDMVTSPLTRTATWIYAVGIGLVAAIIRLFGAFPEGVMYAILLMNTFVPLLNATIWPRIFGEKRAKA